MPHEHQAQISFSASLSNSLSAELAPDTIEIKTVPIPGYSNREAYVAVWTNTTVFSPQVQPAISRKVESNHVLLHPLNVGAACVIAYSVGPVLSAAGAQPYGNCCAVQQLTARGIPAQKMDTSLELRHVGSDVMMFRYTFPAGLTPKNNGAWLGVWDSAISISSQPRHVLALPDNAAEGMLYIQDVRVVRGQSYTAALFMSGFAASGKRDLGTMACVLGFVG